MKLLLDTHALLWWNNDDPRLHVDVRNIIEDKANEVHASIVSLWEIVIKVRIGKLTADIQQLQENLMLDGIRLLAIRPLHLQVLLTLSRHHRDPFDHLLFSQALAEQMVLISDDRRAILYDVPVMHC